MEIRLHQPSEQRLAKIMVVKLFRLHMPSQAEGKISSHFIFDVSVEQFGVKLKQLRRNFAIAAQVPSFVQTFEHSLNRIESVV